MYFRLKEKVSVLTANPTRKFHKISTAKKAKKEKNPIYREVCNFELNGKGVSPQN